KNHIDESVLDRGFLVVVGEVELVFAGDRLARLAVDLLPQSQRVVDGFTDLAEVVEAQLFARNIERRFTRKGSSFLKEVSLVTFLNWSRLSRSSRNSRRAFKILPSSNARVARAASPTRPSSSVSASRPLAATAVNH